MYNPRMLAQENQAIERIQAAYLALWAPGYRTRRVKWSGGETQVIEIGEGPPLLLIHGGGGYAAQWGPILSALSERHHVLAVDRPGHGSFDYRDVDLLAHRHRFICDFLDAHSRLHYHLCALILFISEHLVRTGCLVERERMADDKRWIDIAPANPFQQRSHVFVHVRLSHLQRQAFREGRTDRELVNQSAVHARNGNDAAFTAGLYGFAQGLHRIAFQRQCL